MTENPFQPERTTLEESLTPPRDGTDMRVSLVTLTPEQAHDILQLRAYQKQRGINRSHVGMLADTMVHGEFVKGTKITFAPDHRGNQVLIDGQHRLLAAMSADWTGEWIICSLWGDKNQAARVYILLDTSQKQRTAAVIGRAAGYDQLSSKVRSSVIAAARYQSLWDSNYEIPPFCYIPPARDCVARIDERLQAFATADDLISEKRVSRQIRTRLTSPMIMAIMTETLHVMPGEAQEFWKTMSTNGEGVPGDLRTLLIEGAPLRAGKHYMPRLVATAWNQRKSERPLRQEKKSPVLISGTTITVPL